MDQFNPDERRAWRIDTFRQTADGSIQPLIDSVFILVAISFFSVGDFWKGLIAASNFIGFLLSAPLTGALNRTGIRRSRVLVVLTLLAAASLSFATAAKNGVAYAAAVALCSAAIHLRQPFFTDLYGEFYPQDRRARRISLGLRFNLIVALFAGLLYGYILDINLGLWRLINILLVGILILCAFFLSRLPESNPTARKESWIQAIAIPFRNPLFLYVQAAWMLVGFANIWTLPLRAVYLAEAERGLGLSPSMVTLILVVIPVALKFLFNPFWARLYQETSFPVMRLSINLTLGVAVLLFFLTDKIPIIILASGLFGIGLSGSPFIWQLWVTRIAAAGEIRIYQSAHAFLAGVRGVVAPFVGFAVLQNLSFQTMGLISCALAFCASVMTLPLLRRDRVF